MGELRYDELGYKVVALSDLESGAYNAKCLKLSHLTALKLARDITENELEKGHRIGSEEELRILHTV